MSTLIKIIKNVINFLRESSGPLEALYYLQELNDQLKVTEKVKSLLLSIEWPTLTERLNDFLLLIQSYM